MATETLRPNGAGSETNLTIHNAGCAANWQCVDEAVADDLTTCVKNGTTSYVRDLYAMPNSGVGSGIINSVTIHFRWRATTNPGTTQYARSAVKTHNTVYDGDEESAGGGSGWHNASKQYTTNPNTTDSWTWDEIDAMEIGGSLKTSCAANNAFFTQIYVIIDYSVETPKTSSDTGQGSEAGASLNSAYSRAETGTGSESLGSRLLGVAEEGGGTEALLTRLLASAESGSGLDGGGLFFASSDVGSGLDAILALETMLTGADSGSGIDTSCLIKALLSTDIGLGTDAVVAFLARFISSELVVGSDHLVVKVESAPKSGGMKLPPGGKTSIPSRRVNL